MKDMYLGVGSNIGDRDANIQKAMELLSSNNDKLKIIKCSSLINTLAFSKWSQPDYLNGVIFCQTSLTAYEVLNFTQNIEKKMGRVDKGTGNSRIIDLDILLYGGEVIADDYLIIPHPLLHTRYFVMKPMVEIASDVIHPILERSMKSLFYQVYGFMK